MPTNISNIYDALHTRVASVLTDHTELYNPYIIEGNDAIRLERGYGLLFGSRINTNRSLSNVAGLLGEVTIINTINIFGAENSGTIRKTAEKTLFENQWLIVKSIEQDPDLSSYTNNMKFISDSGIEFVFLAFDRRDFLMLRSTFTFEYFETL